MSDANKQVMKRVFNEVFNQHRVELIPKLYTEDCIGYDPANKSELHGRAPLTEVVEGYRALFPDHQYEIHNMVAEGDHVCVQWSVKINSKKFQDDFSIPGMSLCELRDGKVHKVIQHWDNLNLFKEIGVVDRHIDLDFAVKAFQKTK